MAATTNRARSSSRFSVRTATAIHASGSTSAANPHSVTHTVDREADRSAVAYHLHAAPAASTPATTTPACVRASMTALRSVKKSTA